MQQDKLKSSSVPSINLEKPSFWLLHCFGWLMYVVIFTIDNAAFMERYNSLGWSIVYPLSISAVVVALLTLPLRYLYRRCWSYPPKKMVLIVGTLSLLVAVCWTPLKNIAIWSYKGGFELNILGSPGFEYSMLFMSVSYAFFMVLVWSSLYFGINYHYRLQEEQQQHLKALKLSHVAQIRMLRYQINPHFLFNTLNAISTLVLTNSKEKANVMISRLSTFLRFSLDNDPESQVRLYEELRALMLYLEIEKTRFDDRLSVEFDVDTRAENVYMPSLLLQPLVENAIKYAVSQMKKGGCIRISATVDEPCLSLSVADNGPAKSVKHMSGKGVGLRNIQDRLKVLYGDSHQFSLKVNEPQGVIVEIRIPIEK